MSDARPVVLPLNDFQRMMRYWDEHQPFNGIDAIETNAPVDADQLRAAAETELAILGVCYPVPTSDGRAVTYEPRPPNVPVEVVRTAFEDHASAELNRPFHTSDPLLRLWVLEARERSHIGMTWRHWPIDGASAAQLFRRILARFVGAPVSDIDATELIVPDPSALAPPRRGFRERLARKLEVVTESYTYLRAFAARRPRPERTALRAHLLELPHPHRPPGATLNDVIAAAVFQALARAFPERAANPWRHKLTIINAIDLRPYGNEDHGRAWGQFLGFAALHMPEPEPKSFRERIVAVAEQSTRSRDGRYFLLSIGGLKFARTVFDFLPRRWRWTLPYYFTPFSAAITNTRFRAEWNAEPFAARFGRSWRIAPLGGYVPLAVDVCSKGAQVSLALTCETGGGIEAKIEDIKATLAELLTQKHV